MIPLQGNYFLFHSLQKLPCLRLGPLKDFFKADMAPFKGPRVASCIASGTAEIQVTCQVCQARLRGHRQNN